MNSCRICLSSEVSKFINDVETVDQSGFKTYIQIFMFCLGIDVSEHSAVSDRLCMKCFKKIITYYEFKTLALSSDAYLKSLESEICIKNEKIIEKVVDDNEFDNNDLIDELYVTHEMGIKEEKEDHLNFDSDDDEVLSEIKKAKEDDPNDTKKVVQKKEEENDKKDVSKKVPRKRLKSVKKEKKERKKKIKYKYPGVCEQCGKFVQNLPAHAATHIPKEQRHRYQCKLCDKTFMDKGSKYRHEMYKHKGKKSNCNICGKEVIGLRAHKLRIHHKERMQHWCHVCGAGFLTPVILETHMMSHTKDSPFECDICHARFRKKVNVVRHKQSVHDKERPHVCQFCSKSFFKKDALQEHLRTHTGERPYKCEECGAAFAARNTLKKHRAIHSDDKPYQCPHCDKKFAINEYLIVHKQTHTKEKNFPCSYCGVRFRRAYHRDRHEFTAHQKLKLKPPRGTNGMAKNNSDISEGSNVSEDVS